jgi:hypothetical protein
LNSRNATCPRRLLQHLDTSHGLDGDEPAARPKSNGINPGVPGCPSVEVSSKRVSSQPRCGIGTPAHPKESMMRFYNRHHRYYCGIDLHARSMFIHILDAQGLTP